jgi:putative endonuclease
MNYRQEQGKSGEDRAALFLAEQGFTIIGRNLRYGRRGEIDIAASRDGLVVFAEVKTRKSPVYGGALYSISRRKRLAMSITARYFMMSMRLDPEARMFRFDLIAVEEGKVIWHQDIFRQQIRW